MRRRFTLTQKLIASFAIIVACMLAALVYTIIGLGSMRTMVHEIVKDDLAAVTSVLSLQDTILAQERAAGRFAIFKQSEFQQNHKRLEDEFLHTIVVLKQHAPSARLSGLEAAYARYLQQCSRLFSGDFTAERPARNAAQQVEKAIEDLRKQVRSLLEEKLSLAAKREAHTSTTAMALAFGGAVLSILVSGLLIYSFSGSMKKLQNATHRIAAGEFDHDPRIPTGDELGQLAEDFLHMAGRLKELEQISLDASPLTRLPGNIAIERSISRRLRDRVSFAMCYLDLDNFKSYNDHYGYIKASDLIKDVGKIIFEAVRGVNDPDAFVGHIGGDDFVVIIADDRVEQACKAVIRDVDALIPSYYTPEDQTAGCIDGVDRYGVKRRFPLVSISIAALVCHPGDFVSAAAIATAAAEAKDKVKESHGSNYIIVQEADIRGM